MSGVGWDIRDSHGELWEFATIPWLPLLDKQGKPQKLPAMREWQLTPLGSWQKPDIYHYPGMPDEEDMTGMKLRVRPGRGAWRPDWEPGWLTNQRTGLWVVDVDDLAMFDAMLERGLINMPETRCQSTGRVGGGMHLLFDGRNLPEKFWRQGGLGNPPWGDLKAAGWVAAQGAHHPLGPVYARLQGWPEEICEPPADFAELVMSERKAWRDWLNENSRTGRRTGYRNVASTAGEMRNVRLCSLRGILFNRVPEMDDDEIAEALTAANEEFPEPLTAGEMQDTVLLPKPGWIRHPALDKPEPLTDRDTPWLARDPAEACTGLDPGGRVPLHGDTKADNDPGDVLKLAWAVALGHASPHVAVLGRDLVVVSGAEQGSLDIGELDATRLRSLCASADLTYIHHVKETEDEDGNKILEEWDEPVLPSLQLCRTALAIPAIRLYRPVLSGISRVPVLRPDRTLLERQGVDSSTMRVYWPDLPVGTIPVKPDRSEVAAARQFITGELLHDFPWSSDADKANCLAMWLTSYLQAFGQYLSPLFVLNAAKSSSGKSFLVTVMVETTGAYFRTWVNLEEEIRKSLTACLMASDPVIILDDVGKKDTVASATLASALTKKQWDDRILGGNKNFRGENNRTWCLTGNNLRLGGDIPSRSVLIHLDPGPSDPKLRKVSDFKLGDISVWLTRDENKIRVIRALLILIADWVAHGCPRSTVQHRFAEWAAVVGGVLEHHSVKGFLDNQARVEEHVHYDEHLGDFFRRWHELYEDKPQGVLKLRKALGKDPEEGNLRIWKGTWPRGRKNNLLGFRDLRTELADALGQDHDGYQVDEASDGHGGVLYKVSAVVIPEDPPM